jgi:biopolymer transport protein ExbD
MKLLILIVACLMPSCIHVPPPTVPTGEEISRTSGDAARKNLKEGSPALYSTSKPEEVVAPAAEPTVPTVPTLDILVNPDGSFELNGDDFTLTTLATYLESQQERGPIVFGANSHVEYGKLVHAIDAAKSLGYTDVTLKLMPPKPVSEPAL